jgi:hypothetical protein
MRWRNARAQPKHDFAPHSVIRTWTSYQNKLLDAALVRQPVLSRTSSSSGSV